MIINSIGDHLYTIIILHGMYQTSRDLYDLAYNIQNNNKHIKIILPNAPLRNISWSYPIEKNVNAWYDYYTKYDGYMKHDIINKHHFYEQTQRIYNIINNELKIIDSKKIIIAGLSQGGTIGYNVALNFKPQLAGFIALHTVFMDNIINPINISKIMSTNISNNIPIYIFSGEKDNIYKLKLQQMSLRKIKNINIINWTIEKNLGHHDESSKEMNFIINSINRLIY